MSIARHHAEWLSLVPVSGPFLSLPVLMEAFPQGLEPHDPDLTRFLRQQHAAWQDATEKRRADPVPQREWIDAVLTQVLDLDASLLAEGQAIPQSLQVEVPEHHELLRPNFVLNDPTAKKPRLLIQIYPRSQELTSYVASSRWKASPDTRITELLHATGVRLGLVTNGEHWMLVDAPKGETTGYASWYASLWLEEPLILRSFRSLLSTSRFFGVSDDQTLEELLKKSASNQQEVTDQLGYQVRKAVEVLIHSLDKADQDFDRSLLADVPEGVLYESALTVMMRLVFLFCAEERELIPSKPFPVYEQNYSVSTISKQLRELADQHGEELLERRFDAWPRLLAAFRAVYGGLQHDDVHIPAYGGSLFNPDRFPFLEGRKTGTTWREAEAVPLPVNNRTVLHLLEALQLLQVKVPGKGPAEARRLSFRALDIEQIGHVYEGLLDHTARRADEPYLGLAGTSLKEPEIRLAELEDLFVKDHAGALRTLKTLTGRSEKALQNLLDQELDPLLASRLRSACQGDDILWSRVQPLAGLIRTDSFGYPVLLPKGSIFVTTGQDRKNTATHYTPRSVTEQIVTYTLEPLVFHGPSEGAPRDTWVLAAPDAILNLKICDMACGSGAFLVQAARYLSARLLEAWEQAEVHAPSHLGITPEGGTPPTALSASRVPSDPSERRVFALRLVTQRCIYGVDINPLAVEMAKLSLWLLTLSKDKPFEFLDHCIRSGDSLVGLASLQQLKEFCLEPSELEPILFEGPFDDAVEHATSLRIKLEANASESVHDTARQEALLNEANESLSRLRCSADLLVAAMFWGSGPKDRRERVRHAAIVSDRYLEQGSIRDFQELASSERLGKQFFHWPLEFPEVVNERGGFDAFLGNPPFINAIEGGLTSSTKQWLSMKSTHLSGTADYSFHFLAQCDQLAKQSGSIGLLLPRPFLNAASAKRLRAHINRHRSPRLIYSPNISSLFSYANVQVASVVLADTPESVGGIGDDISAISLDGDNWWASISGTPTTPSTGKMLKDSFDVVASMTTQIAYDIVPFMEDNDSGDWPRLITTGLIDPFECLWGVSQCRYLKSDYTHPVIRTDTDLPSRVKKRLELTRRPKVLVAGVAGPGHRLEAFLDAEGLYCGAVSTYTILQKDDDTAALVQLCTYLNSREVADLVRTQLGGSSMGSGMLTIRKDFLLSLVIPHL